MRLPVQAKPIIRTTLFSSAEMEGAMPADAVSCLVGCVGLKGFECAHCGVNGGCWLKCAGPRVANCLNKCLL